MVRADETWIRRTGIVLAVASLATGAETACAESQGDRSGSVYVVVGAQQSTSDLLLPGQDRPAPHGAMGGSLEFQFGIAERWVLSLSGNVLGSWFDYNNSVDASGNATELEPAVRLGVNRTLLNASGAPWALVGVAGEYSEVRSWVHNRIFTVPYNLTGPRNFRRGGAVRGMLFVPGSGSLVPFVEASESFYLAHASDPSIHAKYNWLGRATQVTIGLRTRLR